MLNTVLVMIGALTVAVGIVKLFVKLDEWEDE